MGSRPGGKAALHSIKAPRFEPLGANCFRQCAVTFAGLSRFFQLHEDSRACCPAVAVLVVNLGPIRTEVFVHANFRTINPCNRAEPPPSIRTHVPVMSPHPLKIFSRYLAFENRPVLTLQEDNGCSPVKCESIWTLQGATNVPMNVSKRLAHHMMTVSPIAFCRNLRLSTAPAHAQARGVRPDLLVLSQSHNCSLSPRFRMPAPPLFTHFLQLRFPRIGSDADSRLTQAANLFAKLD